MDARVIYGIRDARGLTANEKVFLYTVASHNGGMYSTHDKNYTDMGISKATYYRVRESLTDKKLITVQRLMDAPTVYAIDKTVLNGWNESQRETSLAHAETGESLCETPQSHSAETKVNLKANTKVNLKVNMSESADASSLARQRDESDKNDQTATSLIDVNRCRSDVEVTPQRESQSETLVGLSEDERRKLHWGDPRWLPPEPKAPVRRVGAELTW